MKEGRIAYRHSILFIFDQSVYMLQLRNQAQVGLKRFEVDKDTVQLYFDEVRVIFVNAQRFFILFTSVLKL